MVNNVVIAGKAGSGKDTIGDWLVAQRGYERVSLAGPLKRFARELWPDLDWSQKQRPVLQQFGMACRDIDPATWLKLCWADIEMVNDQGVSAVVTDCRYLNELDFFRAKGAVVFRVEASYVDRVARLRARDGWVDEMALQHISETNLDGVELPTVVNDADPGTLIARTEGLLARLS